ncbi:unnamed protein product [Sphagnum tenellum]
MDHIRIASVSCFADSIVMLNLYVVHFMLKPRVNGSCPRTREWGASSYCVPSPVKLFARKAELNVALMEAPDEY